MNNFLDHNKILHHPEKFTEWYRTGDTTGPVAVKIDLTNVCNHNCPGCYDFEQIQNDNNSLPLDVIESTLQGLRGLGTKSLNYTGGGEPTAHNDFTTIIERTAELGFDIGLITNGSRFHKLPMEQILRHFTWIRVSLDAYDEITHKRTHGSQANFDLTVANLERLVAIKKEQGLDVTIGVGILTNQHPDMDRNMIKGVQLCKRIGVDYVQLRPSFGTMGDYISISPKRFEELLDETKIEETEDFSVVINYGKYRKILSQEPTSRCYTKCHAQAFKSTSISARGEVFICCSLADDPRGLIGNVKTENIASIWLGKTRRELLNNLDVDKCPALCVGDSLNEYLENYTSEPTHKNFP